MWFYFQEDWTLQHKVTFDGVNKTITVGPNETSLSIRVDVYSAWKEWLAIRDNGKYLPAIRVSGGDPIGGGQFTGDVYFLINGWKLLVDVKKVRVSGVLYSDNYDTAYWDSATSLPVYPAQVSSVVNAITTEGGMGASPAEIWNYSNRTLTTAWPTVTQIRQEMDANSTKLASIQTAVSTLPQAIRTELTPELTKVLLMENGLTETQAVMLTEIYKLYGLSIFEPLVVTNTSRSVGDIQQQISSTTSSTTITRVS